MSGNISSIFGGGSWEVGDVVPSPINKELPDINLTKWLALDGRDITRTDVPELAEKYPVGVFTSTARTLNSAPVVASIIADSANFVAAGAVGASALQYSPDGGATAWSAASGYAAGTSIASLINTPSRIIIAGSGGSLTSPFTTTAAASYTPSATTGGTTTALTQGLAYAPFVATINAGSFVVGVQYRIETVGTTNFVAIGAASNTVGVVFTATGVGTGSGTAKTGRTVMVKNGSLATASGIFYLNDGSTTWVAAGGGSTADRKSITWSGQKYVIPVSGNFIQTSSDGATFVDQYIPYVVGSAQTIASDGNGTLVIGLNNRYVIVSKDHGVTWRRIVLPRELYTDGNDTTYNWSSFVSFANGKFFIGGGNVQVLTHMAISVDALSWVSEPIFARGMAQTAKQYPMVAYKAGVYCIIDTSTSAVTATESSTKFRLTSGDLSEQTVSSNTAAANSQFMPYIKCRS